MCLIPPTLGVSLISGTIPLTCAAWRPYHTHSLLYAFVPDDRAVAICAASRYHMSTPDAVFPREDNNWIIGLSCHFLELLGSPIGHWLRFYVLVFSIVLSIFHSHIN